MKRIDYKNCFVRKVRLQNSQNLVSKSVVKEGRRLLLTYYMLVL